MLGLFSLLSAATIASAAVSVETVPHLLPRAGAEAIIAEKQLRLSSLSKDKEGGEEPEFQTGLDAQVYIPLVYSQPLTGTASYCGNVYWSCPNYYVFNAPANTAFRILLTQLSGNGATDLFVGNSTVPLPGPSQYTYASMTFAPIQVIDVTALTCGGNTTCPWFIAVAAYNPGFNLYSIVVKDSVNTLPVTLLDGQPQSTLLPASCQQLPPNALPIYDYYNITIVPGSSLHGLTISLDSYYGEGDVFVTLNDNSGSWPSLYNSFASASGGNNLLYISYADANVLQLCPFNAPCKVAIAVTTCYSLVDYLYTITASTDATPTSIISGIATSGIVQQGVYAYFNFTPPFQGDFTIYVTSISGDPDMYISANMFTYGVVPSVNNYTWAQATDQDEVQVIKTTDGNYQPPPAWYIIGVFGYTGNTTFSILAQMNGNNITSQLSDGVAQAGVAAPHGMAYFTFQLPTRFPIGYPYMGVDFAAIPQSGDCDIYISNMTTINPTTGQVSWVFPTPKCLFYGQGGICYVYGVDNSTYTWSSAGQGSKNFISLPRSTIFPGEQFLVAVFATTRDPAPGFLPPPTVFSVIAASGYQTMQLPMGQQIPGVVVPTYYKNYRLTLTAWGFDVVIHVDRVSGGAFQLFAADFQRPTSTNYNWSSPVTGFSGNKYILIPFSSSDPTIPSISPSCKAQLANGNTCTLYISVLGAGALGLETQYQIGAQISGSSAYPFGLSDGQPLYTYIPPNAYEYFFGVINATQYQSIFVVVQNLVGSTTMYLNFGNKSDFSSFYVPGGPPAAITTPDMGGYERVDIFPPNSFQQGDHHSVMQTSPIGNVGSIILSHVNGQEDIDLAVKDYKDDIIGEPKIVARMPDGAIVIEVPLRNRDPVSTHVASNPFSDKSEYSELSINYRNARAAEKRYREGKSDDISASSSVSMIRLDAPPPPPPRRWDLWCASCFMYLTVAANSPGGAQIVATYTAGSTYTQLINDVPQNGYSPKGWFGYYSYEVVDPTTDLYISVTPSFGDVDVFISIQIPTVPNFMPGHFNNYWQFHPYLNQYSILINHTDVNFCRPRDGSTPGVPCVFLIGVFAMNNETATYTIYASADQGNVLQLTDGGPQPGTVLEGTLQYYQFSATNGLGPIPPVSIVWTNIFGAVNAYINNRYDPTIGATSLPGPSYTGCQWIANNFSGIFISAADPCYDPLHPVYTIGIYGNSGYSGLVSQYVLTASIAGDSSRLLYGTPTTNIFVPKTFNVPFTFEVLDFSNDFIVAATPTYGEVGLLVAPVDYRNGSVPGCSMACSGCQVICANYTWNLPSFGSSPVLYMNVSDPCNPPVPAGTGGPSNPIIVSPQCDRYSMRPGRYWAVLYGYSTISETSLTVVQNGQPMQLADGQPQDLQTGPLTLCPNQRDNRTGACIPGYRPSTITYNNQLSVLTFRIPYSAAAIPSYVIVDRLCNGNTTGVCGQPLHVYIVACAPSNTPGVLNTCNTDSRYPSMFNSAVDFRVSSVQGAVQVSYNMCGNSAFSGEDCLFYVGVYPICSEIGLPGQNCQPSLFRATFSSDAGVERVPNDCLGLGNTCVLPEVAGIIGSTKRYLAYAGDSPTKLTLRAEACSGSVVMSYCDAFNGNCLPPSYPAPSYPGHSDVPPVTSSLATLDAAQMSGISISGSLFYLGVQPVPVPGSIPSFQVIMQSGSGLMLSAGSGSIVAIRNPTGTQAVVTWPQFVLKAPGQLSQPATSASYYVYAYPGTSVPTFNIDTPCGNDDAWNTKIAGQVRVYTSSTSATLTGLQPTIPYVISVVAMCSALTCVPNGQMDQRAGMMYMVVYPPPAPSPSPQPPAPSSAGAAGLSPGAAAGISITVLLLLGGGGFWYYRRSGGSLPDFSLPSFGGSKQPMPNFYTSDPMFSSSASSATSTYAAPSIQGGSTDTYTTL
jgi:hypothetical protein